MAITDKDIKRIKEAFKEDFPTKDDFGKLENRMAGMENKFSGLSGKIGSIDDRVANLEKSSLKIDVIPQIIEAMRREFATKQEMAEMKTELKLDINLLKDDVAQIKKLLETEYPIMQKHIEENTEWRKYVSKKYDLR